MPNKITDTFNHLVGTRGFDYDQIDEFVFIGTNMCCQVGFAKELLVKGVRADISLEEERVDAPKGVDYFLWLPTKDQFAPTLDKLQLGIQVLNFLISRGIKIYIHCKNGHGRAPTLYAAYLISKGKSLEESINYLKTRRPSIHFHESQLAVLRNFKLN